MFFSLLRIGCVGLFVFFASACSDDDGVLPVADANVDHIMNDGSPDQVADECIDILPLSLNENYCVVAKFTAPIANAYAMDGQYLYTFENTTTVDQYVVNKRALDIATHMLAEQGEEVFSFTDMKGGAFAGQYLAVHDSLQFAVGLTYADQSGDIYIGDTQGQLTKVSASGNFDAVFYDTDTLLVNGQGIENIEDGQGVYFYQKANAAKLITQLGSFSGYLGISDTILFAGGYATENEIRAFDLNTVDASLNAATTIDATNASLIYAGNIMDSVVWKNALVLIDDDFTTFNAIHMIAVIKDGTGISKGSEFELISKGAEQTLRPSALFAYGDYLGVLLTNAGDSQLIFIKAK